MVESVRNRGAKPAGETQPGPDATFPQNTGRPGRGGGGRTPGVGPSVLMEAVWRTPLPRPQTQAPAQRRRINLGGSLTPSDVPPRLQG